MSSGRQSVAGWSVVTLIVLITAAVAAGCIGFGVHLTQAVSDPADAQCGGRTMRGDDRCITLNGGEDEPRTAAEQADSNARGSHVAGWVLIAGGVIAGLSGLGVAKMARRVVREHRARTAGGAD